MKKLFFIVTLGVAGMMNATVINNLSVDLEKTLETTASSSAVLLAPPDHAWIAVPTWCGKIFYLDINHYSSEEELISAAAHFTDAQCGKRNTEIEPWTPGFAFS